MAILKILKLVIYFILLCDVFLIKFPYLWWFSSQKNFTIFNMY